MTDSGVVSFVFLQNGQLAGKIVQWRVALELEYLPSKKYLLSTEVQLLGTSYFKEF